MIKFSQPIDGGQIKFEDFSGLKGSYNPGSNVIVRAPFDGEVVEPSVRETCEGKFKIKHKLGEKVFFSNFCNLPSKTTTHSPGSFVRKDSKIGETDKEKLVYWITNEDNKKQDIESFFYGNIITSTETSDKKKEEKPTEKRKEEKKPEKPKQEKKEKEVKTKSYDSGPKSVKVHPFLDILTLPLRPLQEEVTRIKQLMK